jgi:hypothetical protein
VSSATARKRKQRRREREGLMPLAIEVHEERFLRALLVSKRMSHEEALRRDLVARAAGAILDEFALRWLNKKVTA